MSFSRLAALAALLLAAPATVHAAGAVPLPPPPPGTTLLQQSPPPAPASRGLQVAASMGFSKAQGGGDSNPLLRVDAIVPVGRTPAGLGVAFVLPLRATYLRTQSFADFELSGVQFEVTPSARLSLPFNGGKAALRADAGVGVVHTRIAVEMEAQFLGKQTIVETDTAPMMRFALGADFDLSPKLRLSVEPLSFGYDFDGGADWTFVAGATFRL
jgi:hypothetical protein